MVPKRLSVKVVPDIELLSRLTNNSDSIGKKMAARDLVETTQVGETGSADLATVGSLTTITDQKHSHLTLRRLDGRVGLTRGNSVTLSEEEEVVNESLHVLLHSSTGRWADLVILYTNGAGGHLVQALVNDTKRLAELLHTAEVTIVAVAVHTNRYIEFDLVVSIVRLGLANIPWDTGSTEHDTSEAHVKGISSAHDTNSLGSGLPDTVVGKQLLSFVDAVTELSGPLVDIIEQTKGKVLGDTAGADIGGMKTGSRYSLVKFLVKKTMY